MPRGFFGPTSASLRTPATSGPGAVFNQLNHFDRNVLAHELIQIVYLNAHVLGALTVTLDMFCHKPLGARRFHEGERVLPDLENGNPVLARRVVFLGYECGAQLRLQSFFRFREIADGNTDMVDSFYHAPHLTPDPLVFSAFRLPDALKPSP